MRSAHFERLYADHAARLYSFLAYQTGDRTLAEDLLADVFERVLTARRPFDPRRGSEQTWLYAIAVNRLRDHTRRTASERRAVERLAGRAEQHDEDPADDVSRRLALQPALAALSDEERETVALRFGAGLTAPEIARAVGEPLTTVEGRLYRALRKLRAALPEQERRAG